MDSRFSFTRSPLSRSPRARMCCISQSVWNLYSRLKPTSFLALSRRAREDWNTISSFIFIRGNIKVCIVPSSKFTFILDPRAERHNENFRYRLGLGLINSGKPHYNPQRSVRSISEEYKQITMFGSHHGYPFIQLFRLFSLSWPVLKKVRIHFFQEKF